jgi:hypothetical protein
MYKEWSFRASVSVSAKGGEKLAHSWNSVIYHVIPPIGQKGFSA